MNILIENAVPLNNGDAALIFSIGNEFQKKGDTVYYSTFNYSKVRKKYKDKNWIRSPLSNKILTSLPVISKIYLILYLLLHPIYKEIDAVVSAPGGYVNSFYGVKKKLILLELLCRLMKKPIYMYSQSIGDLTKADKKRVKRMINITRFFYVRDTISSYRARQLDNFYNVYETKDAAFLFQPQKLRKRYKKNKVAISVREWNQKPHEMNYYKDNIKDIVNSLIARGYQVTFLSTCQGEREYTDDSEIAKKIVSELLLDGTDISDVMVDDSYYTFDQLTSRLTDFDFVVGTRLHMCILSWINGIPAFNISYEEKGKECFKYLGIENYSISYGVRDTEVGTKIANFIEDKNFHIVFDKVDAIHLESLTYFDKMRNDISLIRS